MKADLETETWNSIGLGRLVEREAVVRALAASLADRAIQRKSDVVLHALEVMCGCAAVPLSSEELAVATFRAKAHAWLARVPCPQPYQRRGCEWPRPAHIPGPSFKVLAGLWGLCFGMGVDPFVLPSRAGRS